MKILVRLRRLLAVIVRMCATLRNCLISLDFPCVYEREFYVERCVHLQ